MDRDLVQRALFAAGIGDEPALRELLERAPDLVRAVGDNPFWGGRVQPLHLAVTRNRPGCVALLLAAGADPDGDNEGYGGWSPLMLAAGRPALVEALENARARIGFPEAVALGREPVVARFLDEDPARARAATPDGTTPLHLAATAAIAERLLDAGAELDAVDDYGGTPLDRAVAGAAAGDGGRAAVARCLLARGARADAATFAALDDLEALARALDERPEDLDRPGRAGRTPLQAAAAHGRLSAVEWLLARGAEPNAADRDGVTPLHAVAGAPADGLEIARRLLEAGADPTRRDGHHDAVPADWAAFQERPELEAALRTAG